MEIVLFMLWIDEPLESKYKIWYRVALVPSGTMLKLFSLPAFSKVPPVCGIFSLVFGFVTSEAEWGATEASGDRRVIHYFNSPLTTITLRDKPLLTYCSCKINFSNFLPFNSPPFNLALSILFPTKIIVVFMCSIFPITKTWNHPPFLRPTVTSINHEISPFFISSASDTNIRALYFQR